MTLYIRKWLLTSISRSTIFLPSHTASKVFVIACFSKKVEEKKSTSHHHPQSTSQHTDAVQIPNREATAVEGSTCRSYDCIYCARTRSPVELVDDS